jgi:hypothetical protein
MRAKNPCLCVVLLVAAGSVGSAKPPVSLSATLEAQSGAFGSRSDGAQLPGAPKLTTTRGLRYPTSTEVRLLAGGRTAAFPYDCPVDFDDTDALNGIPDHAATTFTYAPWWYQSCGGSLQNYAVVRPVEYSHYHLNFEDDTISCLDTNTGTFGRLQPDSTCSSNGIDYTMEPRYVSPHDIGAHIHLYVVNQYVNPNDPYSDSTYDKKPFDVKRFRVRTGSPPVRVCYKKVQEIDGPWLAAPDVPLHGSSPGVWLCWNQLGPGLWDLSEWATNIRELKVSATDGVSIFSIDDFRISVQ